MSPTAAPQKLSKVEDLKARSQYLLEPILSQLQEESTHFNEDGIQILKFHGSYQQDNRDNRVKGQEKDFQFMLRLRSPGGYIPPQLYLTLDQLAEDYGNGTLRATTRQAFQLHGILKRDLKTVIRRIVENLGSTISACGDVNRNVMAPPAPFRDRPEYEWARTYANNIADLLTPESGAYYELWLDGEKVLSGEPDPAVLAARRNPKGRVADSVEPLYSDRYLPRKFKIAVTVPGDNSIDLFTQDIGLVVISNDRGELEGFNVYVGGGMGRTHNKEETFARLADPLGFVPAADIYGAVQAIVATQRDYGDRSNRRHARMKYLIHDWGIAKFKAAVESVFGKAIAPVRELPPFRYRDYLGWHEQGDGKWFLGLPITSGRIKDDGNWQLRSALREIVSRWQLPLLLTGSQDVLIYDVQPGDRAAIDKLLRDRGVHTVEAIDSLQRYAMACPALPTCGLAITESERALPGLLVRIRRLLEEQGLPDEHFVVRMTGCPNGCARPYMAELAFVGSAPNTYQLWLGGSPDQTRLARPFIDRLADGDVETQLRPLFVFFKQSRQAGESFGDFCDRVGFDALRQFSESYQHEAAKPRYRVGLRADVHGRLKAEADKRGVSLTDLACEAIAAYLR
ncbi:sulfite reductase, ferredoxin dependent [Synechococcus elongatus]|uniref:sulfite reductase, ferredoxin dependent n=1 Tax=Synechococcus elongatus TaxID=32046 RepID=UPI000F7F03F2|nr:sulfite reductase, ferredoxin dependent [Synechococcus elongatus]